MLGGRWTSYEKEEDGILKRAYLSGHKTAKYTFRGNRYEYDFASMKQKNLDSARERLIRPPHKMKAPSKPIVPSGRVLVVKVPKHSAGTVIQVPHPLDKSQMINAEVPKGARAGQTMFLPVPSLSTRPVAHVPSPVSGRVPIPSAPPGSVHIPAPSAPPADSDAKCSSASRKTRKDVGGLFMGGAVLVAGPAVAGAVIGDAVDDSGALDGAVDAAADGLEDSWDWLADASADTGDFMMDLF